MSKSRWYSLSGVASMLPRMVSPAFDIVGERWTLLVLRALRQWGERYAAR